MNRTCPICGRIWFLKGDKRKELLRYAPIRKECRGCGLPFEIQREDMSVYISYEDKKERIGGIVEFV